MPPRSESQGPRARSPAGRDGRARLRSRRGRVRPSGADDRRYSLQPDGRQQIGERRWINGASRIGDADALGKEEVNNGGDVFVPEWCEDVVSDGGRSPCAVHGLLEHVAVPQPELRDQETGRLVGQHGPGAAERGDLLAVTAGQPEVLAELAQNSG